MFDMLGQKVMILVSVNSECDSSAAVKSILLLHLREELLCPRKKMQRLARRRAIATVGSGWQQLWHRVWMEDGWWGGGGQGEEAGGAASPGGHLWRPLHTWWDLLVSVRKSHLACLSLSLSLCVITNRCSNTQLQSWHTIESHTFVVTWITIYSKPLDSETSCSLRLDCGRDQAVSVSWFSSLIGDEIR